MDLLSDGRLEIGLGAGWMRTDYDQAGIPYDRPGVRIDRFVEGVDRSSRALFSATGRSSFVGRALHVTGLRRAGPKPVQRPRPPILIGGGGQRMLGIAAREADIVGINPHHGRRRASTPRPSPTMTAAAVDDKVGWRCAAAAGDRLADIELNIRAFIVQRHRRPGRRGRATAGDLGIDADERPRHARSPSSARRRRSPRTCANGASGGASPTSSSAAGDVDAFAPVVAEPGRDLGAWGRSERSVRPRRRPRRGWPRSRPASAGRDSKLTISAYRGAGPGWYTPCHMRSESTTNCAPLGAGGCAPRRRGRPWRGAGSCSCPGRR